MTRAMNKNEAVSARGCGSVSFRYNSQAEPQKVTGK